MWKHTNTMRHDPPPSPNTAVEFRHQARAPSSHATFPHSTRSLPRARRQPNFAHAHPNTPAQTEVSESESGLYRGQYYYDDYYGGEATAHPPTPRSQYEEYATHHPRHHHPTTPRSQYDDYGTHPGPANSYYSEPPEEERTFIPQERAFMPPPPSRCESPT